MQTRELLTLLSEHLFTKESQPEEVVCATDTNPNAVRDSLEGNLKINDVFAVILVEENDGMTYIHLSCRSSTAKNGFHFALLNEDLTKARLIKMMDKEIRHNY